MDMLRSGWLTTAPQFGELKETFAASGGAKYVEHLTEVLGKRAVQGIKQGTPPR